MARANLARRTGAPTVLSAEDIEQRRLAVRKAHHTNQLEGIEPDPDMEPVFEDLIHGRIESDAALLRIKAIQAARRG